MKETTWRISGMHCPHCETAILQVERERQETAKRLDISRADHLQQRRLNQKALSTEIAATDRLIALNDREETLIGFTDDAFFAFAHARANQLIAEFPDRRFMLPGLTAMLI